MVGIGKAVVMEMLKLGASQVITCGRSEESLEKMMEEADSLDCPGKVVAMTVDVTSSQGREDLLAYVSEELGKFLTQRSHHT